MKKALAMTLALAMVLGAGAVLPEGSSFDTALKASAENVYKVTYDLDGGKFVSADGTDTLGDKYVEEVTGGHASKLHTGDGIRTLDGTYYYYNVWSALFVDDIKYYIPQKDGYYFAGWYNVDGDSYVDAVLNVDKIKDRIESSGDGGTEYGTSFLPSYDCTLKAIWQKKVNIKIDLNGGSYPEGGAIESTGFYSGDYKSLNTDPIEWSANSYIKVGSSAGGVFAMHGDTVSGPEKEGSNFKCFKDKKTGEEYYPGDIIWTTEDMELQAMWSRQVKLTYSWGDKKLRADDETYHNAFFSEDRDANSCRVEAYEGQTAYVTPAYFWLQSEDQNYYATQWKDTKTGKVYTSGEEIIPTEDMNFEAVWNKKVELTFDCNGALSFRTGESICKDTGAANTLSYVFFDNEMGVAHSMIKPKEDGEGFESVEAKGWKCVGDSRGKLYKTGEEYYPKGDAKFIAVWQTGWNEDDKGKWYLNEDGITYPVGCWKEIDGVKCKFDDKGYYDKNADFSEVKKGDVNADTKIDVEDAVLVINHVNGVRALTADESSRANVDGNSKIDIEDAVAIIAHVNGIKSLN